jgi:hypothetical protein
MNEGRAIFMLSLFLGAIVAGVVVQRVAASTGQRENPYPALERVEEPSITANVATAIEQGDARTLSRLVDAQSLQALQQALLSPLDRPIADVRSVKFVGATAKGSRVVAAYVLSGKDMGGTDSIVGFVLDVENGQIVGVND